MSNLLSMFGQFVLGLAYANVGEWLFHRYVLHGLGRNPRSFWAYHWYEHHAVCLAHDMIDPGYQRIDFSSWNTQTKELIVLTAFVLGHMPLIFVSPMFVVALYASIATYYYRHRKAHLDPQWARQHLRWHYEHHLCGTHSANWCVTWPWCDYLLGTRIKSDLPSCWERS